MDVLFLLPLVVTMCNAFLIGSSTPNPLNSGFPMTDKHYYTLMDIVTEESKKRRQLQEFVVHLQNEFMKYKSETEQLKLTINTTTINTKSVFDLDNRTNALQREFAEIKSEHTALKQDYQNLQNDYQKLQTDNQQLHKENLATQDQILQLNRHVAVLQKLKSINDLSNIYELRNQSQHLTKEIQSTNSKVNMLIFDGNARKEDFIALFNKTIISDRKMSEISREMRNTYYDLQTSQNDTFKKCFSKISDFEMSLQTLNFSTIHATKNLTENQISIQTRLSSAFTDISKINETVAMTACSTSQSLNTHYTASEVMTFSDIREAIGIEDMDSFKSTGKFTVRKPGLYMIEAHIDADSRGAVFIIKKNNDILTYVQVTTGSQDEYQTGSGLVTANLVTDDKIYILAGTIPIHIWQSKFSCLTIVKVK